MIKFHEKFFIESIPFKKVNPIQKLKHSTKYKKIHKKENELTRFQIYHETKIVCKIKIHSTKHSIPKYLSNTTKVSI